MEPHLSPLPAIARADTIAQQATVWTINPLLTFEDNSRTGAGRMRLLTPGLVICGINLACFGCSGNQQPMMATVPVVLDGDLRHSDPFRLRSAAVNDDVLAVEVSYSGGCRNHEFVLLAPRSFQTMSNSVQLEIAPEI